MPQTTLHRRALLLILAAYLALATGYAVVTPPWQAPDEPAHFNYIRHVWETRSLPELRPGDYPAATLEELKQRKWPPDLPVDSLRYESHQPPLFYLLAAPVYGLAQALGLGLRGTVVALRLVSVVLGAVLLLLAYRLARRALPEAPTLALAATAFVAFLPMHLAVTAAINNDTLSEVVLAGLLLLSLGRLEGRVSQRRWLVLGALLVGVALLTKTTIYLSALALPAAAELGAWWRRGRFGLAPALSVVLNQYVGALVVSGAWFLRNQALYGAGDYFGWGRHDSIVVGQLTTREWLARVGLVRGLRQAVSTLFQSFWGVFGWLGAPFQNEVYWVLYTVTALAVLGLALYAWGHRGLPRPAFWLLGLVITLALAGLVGYNLKFVQHQARYVFPALTPLALLFCLGLREVWAREHERLLLALTSLALAGLAVYGLVVIQRQL